MRSDVTAPENPPCPEDLADIGHQPRGRARVQRWDGRNRGTMGPMFFFFSNRLGCLGSLMVSLIGTALVIGLLVLLSHR